MYWKLTASATDTEFSKINQSSLINKKKPFVHRVHLHPVNTLGSILTTEKPGKTKQQNGQSEQAGTQVSLQAAILQGLCFSSCPDSPAWWTVEMKAEINPFLPILLLVMMFCHNRNLI